MNHVTIRTGVLEDLPRLTEIHNHYVVNTHVTFDVEPFSREQRIRWFHEHSDGHRCRLVVAEKLGAGVLGYAATGYFRPKAAYATTVEASIMCDPAAIGQGMGTDLYHALFKLVAKEDIHRIVAGIVQPNAASNALHEKFGFKAVGTFTAAGRKFGKYWDVKWMERPLTDGWL